MTEQFLSLMHIGAGAAVTAGGAFMTTTWAFERRPKWVVLGVAIVLVGIWILAHGLLTVNKM